MIGWAMIVSAAIIMYKAAEMERRNGALWAAITFGVCILASMVIPWPLLNIVIGFLACFAAMAVLKMLRK